jgi:catechol 2,3-dioxygenase-like lactoylglutathione lyase family enzyme
MFVSNKDLAIGVDDIGKARDFWENVLGFEASEVTDSHVVYMTGSINFYLMKSGFKAPIPSFTVKDLESAKKLLTENGCKIIQEREDSLYYRDVNGHIFDIIERKSD